MRCCVIQAYVRGVAWTWSFVCGCGGGVREQKRDGKRQERKTKGIGHRMMCRMICRMYVGYGKIAVQCRGGEQYDGGSAGREGAMWHLPWVHADTFCLTKPS